MEILIWLAFAVVCALIAPGKNRNAVGWFFWGILGGVVSLIVLLAMPPLGDTKVCQYCGEKILKDATVCKHCKKEINGIIL